MFSVQKEEEAQSTASTTTPELGDELDEALLGALLKCPGLPSEKQLALVLTWNRVDLARSQIFTYEKDWSKSELFHLIVIPSNSSLAHWCIRGMYQSCWPASVSIEVPLVHHTSVFP